MKYQVTFHYQIIVDADDESDAEDFAWEKFFRDTTSLHPKDFVATVERTEG